MAQPPNVLLRVVLSNAEKQQQSLINGTNGFSIDVYVCTLNPLNK